MQDDFPTPPDKKMYGSVIHANIINTLIQGKFIKRAPVWLNLAVILGVALIFGVLVIRFYSAGKIMLISVIMLIVYIIINFFLFWSGLWLDIAAPFFTIFSSALTAFAVQYLRTHRLFQQFVVPEVADQLVASGASAELGGVEKEVSILFSDIRGYTTLSENMTPTQVMEMLNEFHTETVKVYEKYYGRVLNYMGDAQMVVFGAPIEREDHAECACRAGLESQQVMSNLCKKWRLENRREIDVGTGICTGVVALGRVGAEGHKQYTVIGDPVNVASRLQGKSRELGAAVIISPTTAEKVKNVFKLRNIGKVELKGKSEPMDVYTIDEEKE